MSLSYPARWAVLATYFGKLCLVVAILVLPPMGVSLFYGETHITLRYLQVAALCGGLGAWLARGPKPRRMQTNEAMVLVAGMFVFTPLLMTWPIMGAGPGFMDALFEAISGATTTGLSTLPSLQGLPRTFLFGRAWMQWYGGLGVVVLTLAFILPPGGAARQLGFNEKDEEDLMGGTRLRARRLSLIYGGATLLGIAILWVAGLSPFEALTYTLPAVSTGGFAPNDASLAGMALPAQAAVTLLCLVGAVPLALFYQFRTQRWSSTPHLGQALSLLALGAAAAVALTAVLALEQGMSWPQAWREGALMAFSAQTTAGFSSIPPQDMGPTAQVIMMFSMFVGGGVGSTAGGVKLLRLLIFFKIFGNMLSRTALAQGAVRRPRLLGLVLDDYVVRQALFLIVLYVLLILFSWLPFLMMGHPPLASLFEVVSAVGTVGLSAGVTAPELEPLLKGVLCADMLMGRLEIVALLVILYPRTWEGRRLALR